MEGECAKMRYSSASPSDREGRCCWSLAASRVARGKRGKLDFPVGRETLSVRAGSCGDVVKNLRYSENKRKKGEIISVMTF